MSHSICIIHLATSYFPLQRLLAWHISRCGSYSSRGCQGLPRHTIMCNSLGSTWKWRSDSGEHWKGAPPFVSRQCFPNTPNQNNKRSFWMNRRTRPDLPCLPAFFVSSFCFPSSIEVFLSFLECLFGSNLFL